MGGRARRAHLRAVGLIERIIVPVDLSALTLPLMWQMLWLGVQLGAPIEVLFVWTPPVYLIPDPIGLLPQFRYERTERLALARADEVLARILEPLTVRGIPLVRKVTAGMPGPAIVERGEPGRAVGMLTSSQPRARRAPLGSVTRYVMKHARCPLMTFHPSQLPELTQVLETVEAPAF
jgi:nucleotide-binding universal stress UspA family protein